jgi:hypothetical protein
VAAWIKGMLLLAGMEIGAGWLLVNLGWRFIGKTTWLQDQILLSTIPNAMKNSIWQAVSNTLENALWGVVATAGLFAFFWLIFSSRASVYGPGVAAEHRKWWFSLFVAGLATSLGVVWFLTLGITEQIEALSKTWITAAVPLVFWIFFHLLGALLPPPPHMRPSVPLASWR